MVCRVEGVVMVCRMEGGKCKVWRVQGGGYDGVQGGGCDGMQG